MPEPRPLYRLSEVSQSDVVFVVEGEKAADAGCSIGLNVTTSSGGSNAAEKSDWSPLAGKNVVIIPDNDKPGRKYAETVAGIVTQLEPPATVRILDLARTAGQRRPRRLVRSSRLHRTRDIAGTHRSSGIKSGTVDSPHEFGTLGKFPDDAPCHPATFSEVKAETLRWLWPGRIPSAKSSGNLVQLTCLPIRQRDSQPMKKAVIRGQSNGYGTS